MSKKPLRIVQFVLGNPMVMTANCFLVYDEDTKDAAVFDPGFEDDRLLGFIEDNDLKLNKILLTHGHFDHIGGIKQLKDATGAEVVVSEPDSEMLVNPNINLSTDFGEPGEAYDPADIIVKDGDKIEIIPDTFVEVIETPGHTPGSICFLGDGYLVAGDVLFEGSIGRTDFPGGSYSDMMKSLNKLIQLPEDTLVLPGHNRTTTIGKEKRTNPFLR